MKPEGTVFVAVALFMGLIGVIYYAVSTEPAGSTLLAATVGLAVIPGGFLLFHAARAKKVAAQDDPDADVRDGAGPVGAFAASSVWPITLAAGAALAGVGLIFGAWAVVPGLALLATGFVGAALESRSPH